VVPVCILQIRAYIVAKFSRSTLIEPRAAWRAQVLPLLAHLY